jgi:hypothetical protein
MCIDELEDWRKAKALDPEAAGVTGRDAAPLPRLQPYSEAYERHLDANGYAKPNGLPRQLECGQNSVLEADLVGCGKAINDSEIFRCVDCSVPFHRECARKHFIAGESVLTAAMVDEQSRRDNSREGLRIVCSARDYLNEQIPKDWTATELLNSLWGTFMKEQSGWRKLASLPVGESPKDKLLNELEQMLEDRLPNMTDEEVKAAESACDAIIDRIRARRSGSALGEFPTCPSCNKIVRTSWDAHEDECSESELGLGESREPLPETEVGTQEKP